MKHPFPLFALLSVACTGILDGRSDDGSSSPNPSTAPTTGGSGGSAPSPPGEPARDPFKVRNTEPELMPFEMRVRRIAGAIGVDVESPLFDQMRGARLKLGAYDYANGALPDGSWNANRIAAWMSALRPVCNSSEMKAKFPALPENLPQLIRAAWGHAPSAEDNADFQAALSGAGTDPAVSYESICMAVFSAAEFVYR
jgi:hypothetical protein